MDKDYTKKALEYHSDGKPGKIEVAPSKPVESAEDLSLAYSPGVAAPVIEIGKDRWNAYRYTNKGNLVAVVSNGSAVLGLGDVGATASKPVMEGKAMLFKLFADIDAFDIELSEEDPEEFIRIVQDLSPTFGGINLEDIKAPECFLIEEKLRSLLGIPVLHDDQHGTAVVVTAALINAFKITERYVKDAKIVICGAGSAGISTAKMLLAVGVVKENIVMFDSKGAITTTRTDIDVYKAIFATNSNIRSLRDAMTDADVFIGLSKGNILADDDLRVMAPNPIIFALANPVPEISYERAKSIRGDAIVATGRSDYPNQINNVLAFPYLFRGALDTLSTTINEHMMIAAANAIADVAKMQFFNGEAEQNGSCFVIDKECIVPKPGDKCLLTQVSTAVARAAMESGVARRRIASFTEYENTLLQRVDNENFFAKERKRCNRTRKPNNNNREREIQS